MKHQAFLWPDHNIGKRESRAIREAHNALYNDYHEILEALKPFATVPCEHRGNIHCTMLPKGSGVKMCAPCAARAAIAKATGE